MIRTSFQKLLAVALLLACPALALAAAPTAPASKSASSGMETLLSTAKAVAFQPVVLQQAAKQFPFLVTELKEKVAESATGSLRVGQDTDPKPNGTNFFFLQDKSADNCAPVSGCPLNVYASEKGGSYKKVMNILAFDDVRVSRANGRVSLLLNSPRGPAQWIYKESGLVRLDPSDPGKIERLENPEKFLIAGQSLVKFSPSKPLLEAVKEHPFLAQGLVSKPTGARKPPLPEQTQVKIAEDKGKKADIFVMVMQGDFYCNVTIGCQTKVFSDLHDRKGYRPALEFTYKRNMKIERLGNYGVNLLHDTDQGERKFELQKDGTFTYEKYYKAPDYSAISPDPYHEASSEAEKALEKALGTSGGDGHTKSGNYRTNPNVTADFIKSVDAADAANCKGVDRTKTICGINFDPLSCSQDPPRGWFYETTQKSDTEVYIQARPHEGLRYMSDLPQYRLTKTGGTWKINGVRCGSSSFNMN